MASPEVWADARARVVTAAAAASLPVVWPNEATQEPDDGDGSLSPFLAVEISADGGEPIELGGATWDERGTVWIHVLVPSGSGIESGLAFRKAMANAFRGVQSGAIVYDAFQFPPGGADEATGNWYRLGLGVSYRFTDR